MRHDSARPFITLENTTIRLYDQFILPDTCWEIKTNQNWAVIGPNGAGKTALAQALAGMAPVVRGRLIRHYDPKHSRPIGYVSFELHQELVAREARAADIQSMAKTPNLTLVGDLISAPPGPEPGYGSGLNDIAAAFGVDHLLEREILTLSAGEMRKTLLVRAVLKSPLMMILDEPFDGLDVPSRAQLAETIERLMQRGIQIVLVTHRVQEVLPGITHVLAIQDGRVQSGPIDDETLLRRFFLSGSTWSGPEAPGRRVKRETPRTGAKRSPEILIQMNQVTVKYNDHPVIDRLDWEVRRGEQWAVTGPNGAGKTTLMALITGDHPQAYANTIHIMGRQRGSGETVWDIKRDTGMVSSEFQIRYQKPLAGLEAVISGFFDSVGLYRQASSTQRRTALHWMARLGISYLAERPMKRMSFGERRLVLLARALVKSPALLILDEPCQGLDVSNKTRFLDLIDRIGQNGWSHLIYTTHHEDEMPGCITHVLDLAAGSKTGYAIGRRGRIG